MYITGHLAEGIVNCNAFDNFNVMYLCMIEIYAISMCFLRSIDFAGEYHV